jgi:hypothetical protein
LRGPRRTPTHRGTRHPRLPGDVHTRAGEIAHPSSTGLPAGRWGGAGRPGRERPRIARGRPLTPADLRDALYRPSA